MPRNRSEVLAEAHYMRLKETRLGLVLYNANDVYIGRSFDLYGEWSQAEIEGLVQFLRPGMTVLDVGANIGAHSLAFARAVGTGGTVIAIEPQRVVFQTLCANLALNALFHVRPLHAGAGRHRGLTRVPAIDYGQPGNFGGVSLGEVGSESVPVISIDELELTACDLIKIDVEGMESDVLAGTAATIRRFRPVLYVENDRCERSTALIAQLSELGYRLYWHLPALYNAQNWYGNRENVFANIVSVNLLGVPGEAAITINGLRPVTTLAP